MRPSLLVPLAPLALLGGLLFEVSRGNATEVRHAWAAWVPGALALLGALGPALLARGSLRRESARAMVMAALAALATFGVLVVFVPLAAGEPGAARMWPALDALLCGALVALAALGVRGPWPIATLAVAAAVLGRAAFHLATGPSALALMGALFLASAAMLGASLAALRIRLGPRSTRA